MAKKSVISLEHQGKSAQDAVAIVRKAKKKKPKVKNG